jgi:hypothetical protein
MRKTMTLTVDPAGDIIVAGPVTPNDSSSAEVFVAKLDNQGTLLWQRRLHPSCAEAFISGALAPQVEAIDPLRDSVSPVLLDAGEEGIEGRYTGGPASRFFGAALVTLGLVTVTAVAAASPGSSDLRAAGPATSAASFGGTAVAGAGRALAAIQPTFDRATLGSFIAAEPVAAATALQEPAYASEPLVTPAELREQTLATLSAGRPAEALVWAQAFVDAEPDNALSYLCVGAAFQDLGRPQEARQAYDQCVRHAKRGDATECYNLGGRK